MADGEQIVKKEVVGEELPSMAEFMCMLVAIQQELTTVRHEVTTVGQGLIIVKDEEKRYNSWHKIWSI
ncbi:hypothetical protein E2C01_076958 [Portunus trituberculatus]|uniref:Uncharacterized protein n=1 Tax=Portunus trituberculatus TaxID=210409 RepID=A0A5B7ID39_PORTR|nr:hypothetical protein [Portunus trituberculatus]